MPFVILAGAGMGFMLGPASTDAVNRASRLSYGEATGITQTVRNYAASLGLAILGSLRVSQLHSRVTTSLVVAGAAAGAGVGRGVEHRPGQVRRPRGRDPALRPARLRVRDPVGAATRWR